MYKQTKSIIYWLLLCLLPGVSAIADIPVFEASEIQVFDSPLAKQGVAVDANYFYVVDKQQISKNNKQTGELIKEWPASMQNNVLIHMDSLMEYEGKLYASHSNYPHYPMTSSGEVWDAETLTHVSSVSLGIERGSLTWLDRYDGYWWGAFANYDKVQTNQSMPYGLTDSTQLVQFDDKFKVLQSWVLPDTILDRMRPMSNSGGSWGPDGYLYITGHDHGEIYVMQLPEAGSIMHQVALVKVPVMEGQGIAWDRSGEKLQLWGINKQNTKVVRLQMPEISQIREQGFPRLAREVN